MRAHSAVVARERTIQVRLFFGVMSAVYLALAGTCLSGEWPQYRGSDHNGISDDRILKQWPAAGPRQVWKTAATNIWTGWSSFAVSQGKAFTLATRLYGGQKKETCLALDAETGRELWASPLDSATYSSSGFSGDGPRSTPTIDGTNVFIFTAYLRLYCLSLATGRTNWQRNLTNEFGGSPIGWQNAASPLLDGDLIFVNCNAGSNKKLLAVNKTNGTNVWRAVNESMTHATPVAATILGTRQIIFFTQSGLVSVVPTNGAVLWRYAFPYGTSTAASPVVSGDIVFCSANYGNSSAGVRITKVDDAFTATQIWRNTSGSLCNHWSTPVACNGYLYGPFGTHSAYLNPLKCLDAATGKEKWSKSGFGQGGVLLVDGYLLVQSEAGDLVLVEADPTAYKEVARFKALGGRSWNSPAVSNGRIYARSNTEGICLDVADTPPPPLKLQPAWNLADGFFRLQVGTLDGSLVNTTRWSKIEVLATPDLLADPATWTKLSTPLVLSNGLLFLDDPESASWHQRFFIVTEKP